jgi:hypothetical protein
MGGEGRRERPDPGRAAAVIAESKELVAAATEAMAKAQSGKERREVVESRRDKRADRSEASDRERQDESDHSADTP